MGLLARGGLLIERQGWDLEGSHRKAVVAFTEGSGEILKASTERQWWDLEGIHRRAVVALTQRQWWNLEGIHRQAAVTYKGQIKVNRGCGAICHVAINLCAFLHAFQRKNGDLKGRLHLVTLHCSTEAEPLCL